MDINAPKRKFVITNDGSHTLFVPGLNEHYHSTHGAIQESEHVFIKSGLNYIIDALREKDKAIDCIKILEVGFGTGLNAMLTYQQSKKVSYTAIEKYPLTVAEIEKLNLSSKLGNGLDTVFKKMHNCNWGIYENIGLNFKIKKIKTDLLDFVSDEKYNIIYFDAFSPDVQPKLWTEKVFCQMYNCLNTGGILVTYSAKGLVKQNLRAAGFTVKRLPGPPGKRHMVRAYF